MITSIRKSTRPHFRQGWDDLCGLIFRNKWLKGASDIFLQFCITRDLWQQIRGNYWNRCCSTIQKKIYFLLGFYYFNTKRTNHITLVKNVCTWIFKSVWTKCSRCSWHRLMCGILLCKGTVQKTDFDACGHWQKTNSMVFRGHTCIATHLSVFSRGHLFGSEVVDHPAALQAVEEEKVPVRSISLRQRLPNTCKQIFRHVWRYRPWIL